MTPTVVVGLPRLSRCHVGLAPPWPRQVAGLGAIPGLRKMGGMNRSVWAARYRRLGRDAAFLFLSWPLSLLAFCLVLPLALSISGGFANLARLRVARLDGREPRPGAYLSPVPGASARRRLFRRLRDPQRWMDLLWVIVYFPVSLFTWIISVGWLALAVGGLLSPIIDVILELILNATVGDQSQSLAELLGLYPPLLWEIGIHLSAGVVFSLTAPFVLRGLTAMQSGLIHGMLSWRSEVSRLEQMARY